MVKVGFGTIARYLEGKNMSNQGKKKTEVCAALAGCSGQMELPLTLNARQVELGKASIRHLATVHDFRHSGRVRSNASSVDALKRILDFASNFGDVGSICGVVKRGANKGRP